MIIGLGCDLIEVARIEQDLQTDPGLRAELFTPAEITYCESQRYPARNYAARFAAKEALYKALGSGRQPGMLWHDIEVQRSETGAPSLQVSGLTSAAVAQRRVRHILISLSHTEHYGAATVLLES